MKKIFSLICTLCLGAVLAMAQEGLRKVGTGGFSLVYDPGVWRELPADLDVGQIPEYYYLPLLRLDGKGMLMVFSHAVEDFQNLQHYATTMLATNSIFGSSGKDPVAVEAYGRNALYSTFTKLDSNGKAWFFSEKGRNITFLTLDKDDTAPGLQVFRTLRVHPRTSWNGEMSEEELIATFRSLSDNLSKKTPDDTPSKIVTLSLEIEPENHLVRQVLQYNITDSNSIQWLRGYLSDPETFARETYPIMSNLEKRAVALGYSVSYIYLDAGGNYIGTAVINKTMLGQ